DHPDVAHTLDALGALYGDQGNYSKEEVYLRQALAIYEKKSPDSDDLSFCLHNLGSNLMQRQRWHEAEPILLRALKIQEKVYRPGHPYLAPTYSCLGAVYQEEGRLPEAEHDLKLALEINET